MFVKKLYNQSDGGAQSPGVAEVNQIELTKGEFNVGISFNPGGHPQVDSIKQKSAALIDELESYRPAPPLAGHKSSRAENEQQRLISLAQTKIEEAAMWAVKAVTKK